MIKLIFTESYEKRAVKFIKKHPELKEQYGKVLKLLALNPYHPSLRLHKLKGRMGLLNSISINYSYRITLKFLIKENTIIPIDIGQHDEVY